MRVAPLSLAVFLALVSSEEGFRGVCILKALATIFFLHHCVETPMIRLRVSSRRDAPPLALPRAAETNDDRLNAGCRYYMP